MGGIISGLLGIGSAAVSASLNARENYKQRQHQTSERVASQQWQDMQRREQNQFSESMYKRYQSPQAMVNQYRAAGLNPLLAVDGTAAPAVSSGSSGSAPMGGSTSAVPIMAPSTLSGSFQDIAGGLKALADARKAGVETDLTESIADDIVKSWKLSNVGKEIANGISATKLRYLDQKEQLEVQQALQALSRGDIGIKEARENLRLLEKRNLLTQKEVDWYDQRIFKQLQLADSEISKNEASAQLAFEQSKTEDSKRSNLAASTNLLNLQGFSERQQQVIRAPLVLIGQYQLDELSHNLKAQANVKKAFSESLASLAQMPGVELATAQKQLDLLGQESVWKDPEKLSGILGSLVGDIVSAAVVAKIFKGFQRPNAVKGFSK